LASAKTAFALNELLVVKSPMKSGNRKFFCPLLPFGGHMKLGSWTN